MNILQSLTLIVVLGATSVNAQVNLTSGLQAHLPLNGDGRDSSQYGRNGVLKNVIAVPDRFGRQQGALRFDGNTSTVNLTNTSAMGFPNFSFCAWAKPAEQSDIHPTLVVVGTAEADQYIAIPQDGRGWMYGSWYNYGPDQASTYIMPDTNWHHVLVTRSNNIGRIYVDCILQGEVYFTSASPAPYYGTSPTKSSIGSRHEEFGYYYAGDLDDVRIYNRILNSNEISALCAYGKTDVREIETERISLFYTGEKLVADAGTRIIDRVTIYDLAGKICYKAEIGQPSLELELPLPSGFYIAVVGSGERLQQQFKFFIQ